VGVDKGIIYIIHPYPHLTQNRRLNGVRQLDMLSRQTRIFLNPCLNIEFPLSIKIIKCNTLIRFLFHMFTNNNIYYIFSLHATITIQHQISLLFHFKHLCSYNCDLICSPINFFLEICLNWIRVLK
jgi:hypothetical protein